MSFLVYLYISLILSFPVEISLIYRLIDISSDLAKTSLRLLNLASKEQLLE